MDAKQMLEANIIDLLGLQNLPEGQKQALLNRMTEVVQDRIGDRISESLSAEDRAAFDQLLDRNVSDEEVNVFLTSKIPEFGNIAAEEMLRFKQQMVDDANTVRKIAATA